MSQAIHQKMTPIEIGILGLLSLLWGGSFFFVEILVDYFPPLTIVTVRVALAAILLWAIVFVRRIPRPQNQADWVSLFIVGLLNNALPFCLIVWGQTRIDSGLASILNSTAPIFTVIVAGFLLADERITLLKVVGVLMGLAGVITLIGPDALQGLGGSLLGQLAVIGAAFSYALAGVYSRRFADRGISPMMIATGQVTMATLMLLPLTFFIDGPAVLTAVPLKVVAALLALALFSTVLAYVLYFRLIATAGATNATLVGFLIPISAVALGVIFLNEAFTGLQIAGAVLIGLGLLIMDGRIVRRFIS